MTPPRVRAAGVDDLPRLQDIERAAGGLFRAVGMDLVADDQPLPLDELRVFADVGRAWVAEREGAVAGYLLAAVVDGCAHVEQVSVDPSHARRRVGAALVEHLDGWARDRGLPALTLTTYLAVPWNGPYYEALGFRPLADDEVTPGLRELRRREAEHGLDRWPRGCLRREVTSSARRSH